MSYWFDHLENIVITAAVVVHFWLGLSVRNKENVLAGAIMSSASIIGLVALHIGGGNG